jgi:hypothetical protein
MHDLIYGSLRFPDVGSQSEEPFYFRNYSLVDVPRLIQDVDEFDWTPTPSLDEQVDFFNGAVRGFCNAHVPLKRGRCSDVGLLVNPWYNAFVEKAIVDGDKAFLEVL